MASIIMARILGSGAERSRFLVPATAGAMICFFTVLEPQTGQSTCPFAA